MRSNFIVFCLFLSSCVKRQTSQPKVEVDHAEIDRQKEILDVIIRQEAMLVDILIPIYDERIIQSCDDVARLDTLFFGYKSPLSCSRAHDFFMTQMERYGWQHLVSFEVTDLLLQFASPYRYCTIIIKKSDDNSAHSSIFIYIKRLNQDSPDLQ